jgi:putative methyltransferase (TIGR04325 family)
MKEIIKKIPPLKKLYDRYAKIKYEQKFANDCYGCFWGVFDTFEEAIQAAPSTKNIGYDCADLAQEYKKMLCGGNWEASNSMVRSFDYPVLFWLDKIMQSTTINSLSEGLRQQAKFFDFGGNLGIHFLSYSRYLALAEDLVWIVCDLPEIIKVGSSENKDPRLTFTTDFKLASGSDVFLASGSVQYDEDIATKIDCLTEKPQHLLINRLGLYEGKKIVTLQNGGKVFYPQYIFNQREFIDSLTSIGYELIDLWEDNIDNCYIPFHPEVAVPHYYGLYFKLNNGNF